MCYQLPQIRLSGCHRCLSLESVAVIVDSWAFFRGAWSLQGSNIVCVQIGSFRCGVEIGLSQDAFNSILSHTK